MRLSADSSEPLAVLGAIHYKHVTDMAWSKDGSTLAISSHDGYCTLATFQPSDLGDALAPSEVPDLSQLRAEIARVEGAKVCAATCHTPTPASADCDTRC